MRGLPDHDFDLIRADSALLDTLARRDPLAAGVEPLIRQLAAWAADADAGADAPDASIMVTPDLVGEAVLVPVTRRNRRNGSVVLVTMGAVLLGSTGVAAAVTGDPLSPFRAAAGAVASAADAVGLPIGGDDKGLDPTAAAGRSPLPDPAAVQAEFNRLFTRINVLIAQGRFVEARALLDAVDDQLGQLSPATAAAFTRRVEQAEVRLARAEARAERPAPARSPGQGKGGSPESGQAQPGGPSQPQGDGSDKPRRPAGEQESPGVAGDPGSPADKAQESQLGSDTGTSAPAESATESPTGASR